MVSESRPQEGSTVNMPSDGDAVSASSRSNNSSEEKVKVVVRVRPLQAREEPWSKAAEADVRGPDVNSTATITVQENEVIWEKNGQLKILKADAVFANGALQDSVYRSVSDNGYSFSPMQIYNEKIFDILSPEVLPVNGNQSPDAKAGATKGAITQRARWNSSISAKDAKSLQIRQKLDGSVFVDGMTSRNVTNKAELLQAFREVSPVSCISDASSIYG
ncbi:hypothetical protein JG688_00001136 [Phytophthora aleatoria]|uniref:Kinesin motor domain-containing protein n=1 Tax=Phytophthora aleatoria TaxID=2496075 RepID=A0A8J5MJ07_9STRA|nr:hypothetical protein JG688_00001136 [Phytophthora aleatoria]